MIDLARGIAAKVPTFFFLGATGRGRDARHRRRRDEEI